MNANREPSTLVTAPAAVAQQRLQTFSVALLATVSAIMLFALTVASIGNLMAGGARESGITPGSLPYFQMILTTLLLLSPVMVAFLSPFQSQYGARLPSTPALPRFIAAASLAWLAMGVTGVANPWVRHWLGHAAWTGFSPTREIADAEMVFLAINAGISEEAAYLALPFGVTYLVGYGINLALLRFQRPAIPVRYVRVAAIIVTVLFSAAHRFAGHLYQGEVSAFLGIVWGVALAAVFTWVRSIWPLMLGHLIYDLPVHYGTWAGLISHHVLAPAAIAALALLWLRRSSRNKQAHECLLE